MAESNTTATTRPARARKAASPKPATSTAARSTAKPVADASQAGAATVDRFRVELEHAGDTKSYSKFAAPDNLKGVVVGAIYAPLGTKRIAVLVIGPDGPDADSAE